MAEIFWLSDEDYAKAEGQLRLNLNDVFNPFNCYGLHLLIPAAIDEVVELAIDFSRRVRGQKDHPIQLKKRRNARK